MSFKYIFISIIILGALACKQEVVTPDQLRSEVDDATDLLQFTLLDESPSQQATTTLRILGMQENESIKIYNDIYCANEMANALADKNVLDVELSFSGEDTYTLYYVYINSQNQEGSCRSTKLSYTYDITAPLTPTLSLLSNSIDNDSTPSFYISNMSTADTLKIYSDPQCTSERLSYTATSSSAVAKQITTGLAQETDYSFYYTIEDQAGNFLKDGANTCHAIALANYTYDITLPETATGFVFDTSGAGVNAISKKLLRAMNTGGISSIQIYQENTCATKLCDSSDVNQFGVCVDNETNENYNKNDYNYFEFLFDATSDEISNYYFKYKVSNNESSCLKVGHYLVGNSMDNNTPLFMINDQAQDNNNSFKITASGVTENYTLRVYADQYCYSSLGSSTVAASATTVDINLSFSTSGTYDLHYRLSDQAGNYALFNGNSCISAGLTYLFDIGAPGDPEQELIAPTHLLTQDDNVEVTKVEGSLGTLKFSTLTTGETLYVYAGASCSGSTLAQENITSTSQSVTLNLNALTDEYISFKNGSAASCQSFNFMPTKKDGTDSTITLSLSNLQIGATLYIYPDTNCTLASELYSETITQTQEKVSFDLTSSGSYSFSTKVIDESGNESNCVTTNPQAELLEYTYYKVNNFTIGENHTCLDLQDPADITQGLVYCWGDNRKSQLGGSSNAPYAVSPVLVSDTLNATSVASYLNTTCLIGGANDDDLYCWGENTLPSFNNLSTMISAINVGTTLSTISTAPGSNSTIEINGLGASTTISFYKGQDCQGSPITTADVIADPQQFIVDTKNQSLNTISYQTDDGAMNCDNFTFTSQVTSIATDYDQISIGKSHACALTNGSTIDCWGDHTYGQIGNGAAVGGSYATFQNSDSADTYYSLSAGAYHTCAINNTDQKVACWGLGTSGQRGDGTYTTTSSIPATITILDDEGKTEKFTKVESGTNFSCALAISGKIYCWGSNDSHQLAGAKESNGLVSSGTATPLLIDSTDTFIDLSIADNNACAINSDYHLYCWGPGHEQMTLITDIDTFQKVEVGANHSCALSNSGQLYCWGNNQYGQLGTGNQISTATPQQVIIDFNKTQLLIENVKGDDIINEIDLKKDLLTDADLTFYYDNNSAQYKTVNGDTSITYQVVLINNSFSDATINQASIGFSQYGDKDYTAYFDFEGGAYPGISGTCGSTLAASNKCTLSFSFAPTVAQSDGMSAQLTLSYSDNDNTYIQHIKVTGYSQRSVKGVDILDENGVALQAPITFGSLTDQFVATTKIQKYDPQLGTITISNPYSYSLTIATTSFSGTDAASFQFVGGSYPGTGGSCAITLNAYSSCTVAVEKLDNNLQSPDAILNVELIISHKVIIQNNSDSAIQFTAATFIGANQDQFKFNGGSFPGLQGDCSNTLAAQSECAIDIAFSPTQDDEIDSVLGVDAGFKISMIKGNEMTSSTVALEAYDNIYIPEFNFYDSNNNDITATTYGFNTSTHAIAPSTTTIKRIFTITNTGDSDDGTHTYSDAKNMVVSIIGDDPTQFQFTDGAYPGKQGSCGTSLAVGESCTVEVEYKPTTTVTTNGGNIHFATIELQLENAEHDDPVTPLTQEIKGYVDI